ncbi:MAG: hypothetical protein M3P87_01490 [Actinomycetota bacterium]|nr:hypothetical protein [Actinomycetota bacterium]
MSEPPVPGGEELKTPFGFKLMVVLIVLYLGWRLVQGVAWLIDRIS